MAGQLPDQEIRTIYFGGGTPSIIGSDGISQIIDHITSVRNVEYLEELSIEINPEPVDQMLDLISTISNRYKHFHRVRFSIGIQSFDNEVLEESGRQYNFQSCVDFLRKLTDIKMEHNIFNFDFIAFGKFNQTRKGDIQLRDPVRLDFFQRFAESGFADSFSLYTLELFE
jgi:oxygen-independent coproporphyrinogen-3 oxidase